jgi:hypothetical protein
MAVFKRVLCKERLRQVPAQFSWIDHRLVRDRHISRCSADALALYLFLVTVADGQGLSYYADATIGRLLPLRQDAEALGRARRELIDNRLIAYQRPLYQVLALGPSQPSSPPQSSSRGPSRPRAAYPQPTGPPASSNVEGPQSLAQIFQKLMELPEPAQDKPLNRRMP